MNRIVNSIKNFFSSFIGNVSGARAQKEASEIQKVEVSSERRKQIFRSFLTSRVAEGWAIEIENEYDAVLSKKYGFKWFGKLIIFLILLFLFAPLALFYLIIIIVRGVTAKPSRTHFSIDEFGDIYPPYWRDF
jgi:hypothetical protein